MFTFQPARATPRANQNNGDFDPCPYGAKLASERMGQDRVARCGRQRRDGQPVIGTGPCASCFLGRRSALAAPEHRWSKYFGQAWVKGSFFFSTKFEASEGSLPSPDTCPGSGRDPKQLKHGKPRSSGKGRRRELSGCGTKVPNTSFF